MIHLRETFETKDPDGNGLNKAEFVFVMMKALGAFVTDKVEFVVHSLELFRQVDVNDDGGMEWEELVSYIVEAGLSKSGGNAVAT